MLCSARWEKNGSWVKGWDLAGYQPRYLGPGCKLHPPSSLSSIIFISVKVAQQWESRKFLQQQRFSGLTTWNQKNLIFISIWGSFHGEKLLKCMLSILLSFKEHLLWAGPNRFVFRPLLGQFLSPSTIFLLFIFYCPFKTCSLILYLKSMLCPLCAHWSYAEPKFLWRTVEYAQDTSLSRHPDRRAKISHLGTFKGTVQQRQIMPRAV